MYYEGFSANMKRELVISDIGTLLSWCLSPLLTAVVAKIRELSEAQIDHENIIDQTARRARRDQLIGQLHEVVVAMTDRMIARLNSNSFIRVEFSHYRANCLSSRHALWVKPWHRSTTKVYTWTEQK